MRTFARVLLVFIGLLFIGGGLFLMALNYQLIPGLLITVALPGWLGENLMLVVGVVLLLIALILISIGLRSRKKVGNAVLKGSEHGEVLVSLNTVENMVLRVVQQTEGIKDVSRQVASTPDGLVVKVRVQVLPDVSIPGVSGELQSKIKEYLEEMTGITVRDVKVLIENIASDQAAAKK